MTPYILNEYNWKQLIEQDIDMNSFAYMGAPFVVTNCKKWNNVYSLIIKIMYTHNNVHNGLYKIFTMIMTILLFKKIQQLNLI